MFATLATLLTLSLPITTDDVVTIGGPHVLRSVGPDRSAHLLLLTFDRGAAGTTFALIAQYRGTTPPTAVVITPRGKRTRIHFYQGHAIVTALEAGVYEIVIESPIAQEITIILA